MKRGPRKTGVMIPKRQEMAGVMYQNLEMQREDYCNTIPSREASIPKQILHPMHKRGNKHLSLHLHPYTHPPLLTPSPL